MKKTLFAAVFTLAALLLKAIEPPENLDELVELYEAHLKWLVERRSIPADDPRLVFHANVTNLWWQGRMSNVLAIAEQRLACNSNDIAGLILKVECNVNFVNLDAISNSVQRAVNCGKTITTPMFSPLYPFFKYCMEDLLDFPFSDYYTADKIEEDRAKALLPRKTMLFEDDLFAVCIDGLVTNYPAQPPSGTAPQAGGGQ